MISITEWQSEWNEWPVVGASGVKEGGSLLRQVNMCSSQPGSSAYKCDLWSQQLEAAMLASSEQQGQGECDLCLVERVGPAHTLRPPEANSQGKLSPSGL